MPESMDAIDKLLARDPKPGIGHNRAPTLAEELTEELREIGERAYEMVICADERCEILDEDSSQRAVQLAGQMRNLIDEIETARVARKKPFLEGGYTVDRLFGAILTPLAGPDHKKRFEGAYGDLVARIGAYQKQRDAATAAERHRLEEEARKAREVAQKAAAVIQQGGVSQQEFDQADLARRRAEDDAAKLEARATATISRPIDSGVGPKTSVRTSYVAVIDDLNQAIAYCMNNGLEKPFRDVAQVIYNRLVRGPNGARSLPGARVIEESRAGIRRK